MNPPDQPRRPHQHPLENYQFSPEEIRALRECNTESFFQRSLPFGSGLGLLAYCGVKNGYLQANVKYGSVPKVVGGIIIGYFVGKFSYQQKCAEKLMRLPNSRMGEILRQRRQGGGVISTTAPDPDLGRAFTLAPFPPSQADVYTDEGLQPKRNSALNLDTEPRPSLSELDDIYRPSVDGPSSLIESELPLEPTITGTTYEDLRKKNREEYAKRQQNPISRHLQSDAPVVTWQYQPAKTTDNPADTEIQPNVKKNRYGDTWSD